MTATASLRRQTLADLARARKDETGGGGRLRTILIAVILIGLVVFAGLWLAGFFSTPPEVLALRAAVDTQVTELARMARGKIPYTEDRASFSAVFDAASNVPRQYREQEVERFFMAREAAEVNSYFALPPAQRAAELDRRIKADEARRARWEAERAQREASTASSNRGGASAAASGQTGSTPGGDRPRRSSTEESRNARSKGYIDRTSPDTRAKRTEYRRARDQRRVSMGLPPSRW